MPRPKVIEEDELLDSLLVAFADLGYEGTSLRELCRHLGISHNLIHRRYASKEAAWHAAVDHGFARLLAELDGSQRQPDAIDELRATMRRYARVTIEHPALARIIAEEGARPGPRFEYMFTRYIGPTRQRSAAALAKLQAAGIIRPGAVESVYFFLTTWGIGGLASAPDALRGTDGPDAALDLAYLTIDTVIDGLRTPKS